MSEDGADDERGLLGDDERFEHALGPDVPSVDVPSVSIPGEDGADGGEDAGAVDESDAFDADVDPEVSRTFWRLVLVFDVALFSIAVGPMFVYFWGDWSVGGPLTALGAVTFGYGVREYRAFRRSRAADSPEPAPDGGTEAGVDLETDAGADEG
ncbi:DUF7322 domain-containing protein [Halosimplex halophilum]|uniref:DUF7322 domain-containing protein n=1 Tax=Halosimplex halophilum TaxID=2559572 RepID=UPI00107F5BBF|nr:hypothetical protein [Halosimplex halophilum]